MTLIAFVIALLTLIACFSGLVGVALWFASRCARPWLPLGLTPSQTEEGR